MNIRLLTKFNFGSYIGHYKVLRRWLNIQSIPQVYVFCTMSGLLCIAAWCQQQLINAGDKPKDVDHQLVPLTEPQDVELGSSNATD